MRLKKHKSTIAALASKETAAESLAAVPGQAPTETEAKTGSPAPEPEAAPAAPAPEPVAEPVAVAADPLASVIAATEAAEAAAEPPAAAEDSTCTPLPAESATGSAIDFKEAVRRRWQEAREARNAPAPVAARRSPGPARPPGPRPAGAFACPRCGSGSANRQGVVAHLRIVHRLEKADRDAALAAAGV